MRDIELELENSRLLQQRRWGDDLKASQLDLLNSTTGGIWLLNIPVMLRRPAVCTYYQRHCLSCGPALWKPVWTCSRSSPYHATALSHSPAPPLNRLVSLIQSFSFSLSQSLSHTRCFSLSLYLTQSFLSVSLVTVSHTVVLVRLTRDCCLTLSYSLTLSLINSH